MFIKANQTGKRSVTYVSSDGSSEIREGGDFNGLSIWNAIPRYAPSTDDNDVNWYRRLVQKSTGLDLEKKKIIELNQKELESLVDAIEQAEGKFKPGKVIKTEAKKKISGVRKNKKGTVIAYEVEGLGWIDKQEAIALTEQGRLDAVISHSRSGSVYLKARPDKTIGNNLETMG